MTIRMILCCGVFAAAISAAPLRAQMRIIPREQLDSLARPQTAPGAGVMHFDRTTIDAGRIDEEQTPPTYVYKWENRGTKPLVITRIVTTCGCAVATWDKRPVKAGESAEVTVTYHPKGHPGRIDRKIFVYTQLSDKHPSAILGLTGTVAPSAGSAAGFPFQMGALQLNRQTIAFDAETGVQEALILCRNAGREALTIGHNARLLPRGFSFVCEPATLETGEEGTMTVRFDPMAAGNTLPQQTVLILEGLSVSPSQSTIRIRIDKTE